MSHLQRRSSFLLTRRTHRLAAGAIAGMVISLVLLLGLVGFIAYRRRLRKRERKLEAQLNVKPYADNTPPPEVSTASFSVGTMSVSPPVTAASQPFVLAPVPVRRPSLYHTIPSGGPVIMSYNSHSSEGPTSDLGHSTSSVRVRAWFLSLYSDQLSSSFLTRKVPVRHYS